MDQTIWRTEPFSVAKEWDDFCVGVKGQSRLVIAGFSRKVYKYCALKKIERVEHCTYRSGPKPYDV